MSQNNEKTFRKPSEKDQPVKKEKLPYVKPELHPLNLDGTEGKITFAKGETTYTSVGKTYKSGPS